MMPERQQVRDETLLGAFLFGFGLIAMVDGIIFHQLLQWHSTYMWNPSRYVQIFSDGVLHVISTAIMVVGATVLWRSHPMSNPMKYQTFWGGLLLGAGSFNLLDGILSHHVLGIHHVRPGDAHELMYDLAFDVSAILLLAVGWGLLRQAQGYRPSH